MRNGLVLTCEVVMLCLNALTGLVTMDNVGEFLMVQAAERKSAGS